MRAQGILLLPIFAVAVACSALSQSGSVQALFHLEATNATGHLSWDVEPNIDATGHLIFNSVNSLFLRWPNTVVRPGHSLVPSTIPPGTILYHGRLNPSVPSLPDWLGFDFEHAYAFAWGRNAHVLSFTTTRALRLIYFDGASAAKVDGGVFDTQEVLMYGEVLDGHGRDGGWLDGERIERLCKWGKPFGIDGFVRMEFHFELMQCNFTDGLKLVSSLHVLPSNGGPGRQFPSKLSNSELHLSPKKRNMFSASTLEQPIPPRPRPDGPARPPRGWHGSLPSSASEACVVAYSQSLRSFYFWCSLQVLKIK